MELELKPLTIIMGININDIPRIDEKLYCGTIFNIDDARYGLGVIEELKAILKTIGYVDPGEVGLVLFPETLAHELIQSRSGSLLAELPAKNPGAFIVVKTHSKCVLNGIRIAVADNVIDPINVVIYFFRDGVWEEIKVNKHGELSRSPDWFMNQDRADMCKLKSLQEDCP